MNPLLAQLTHRPFPEVAGILLAGADQITREWGAAVQHAMPQMRHLTFDELKDSTPRILTAITRALASDDPDVIRELVGRAPAQGLSRFRLNFDVVEVMQEDRLLRAITVQHVEARLGRRMERRRPRSTGPGARTGDRVTGREAPRGLPDSRVEGGGGFDVPAGSAGVRSNSGQ